MLKKCLGEEFNIKARELNVAYVMVRGRSSPFYYAYDNILELKYVNGGVYIRQFDEVGAVETFLPAGSFESLNYMRPDDSAREGTYGV